MCGSRSLPVVAYSKIHEKIEHFQTEVCSNIRWKLCLKFNPLFFPALYGIIGTRYSVVALCYKPEGHGVETR
jgi:hypothetical protein